ncbi:MAG: hypothetical protein FJW99_08235 [Actinobacteria bacterium]|nr:hypothetical protein [Actinomycetota bacterium]MBM3698131.1 hypothetical protein [Actinomycetota bacterium]
MRPRAALILAVPLTLLAGVVAVAAEWSLPAVTLSQEGMPAVTPTVVVDGAGVATALWEPDIGGGVEGPIRSSRLTNGEWGAPANASARGSLVTAPSAAVNASGIVTAAWARLEGSERILQAARFANGAWGPTADIATANTSGGAAYPQAAVDGSGMVTAVWMAWSRCRCRSPSASWCR